MIEKGIQHMIANLLSGASVLLAFLSLAYAYWIARESRVQMKFLAAQTRRLRRQNDRISEMADLLGRSAFNGAQADYFLLRTLANATGCEPRFDESGTLAGYYYRDFRGSATIEFRREGGFIQVVDVSDNWRPAQQEDGSR
jgi:hypothetical protein